MFKKLLLLILIIILICYFFVKQKSIHESILEKNFIKYFNHSDSNIFQDCVKKTDCKLQYFDVICPNYRAINVNNSNIDIEKYIKKQNKLTELIDVKCKPSHNIKTIKAVCEKNICTVKNKLSFY